MASILEKLQLLLPLFELSANKDFKDFLGMRNFEEKQKIRPMYPLIDSN